MAPSIAFLRSPSRRWLPFLCLIPLILAGTWVQADEPSTPGSQCLTCHQDKTPGLYRQWEHSKHAQVQVTCIECHGCDAQDPDAFTHYGSAIATLVTPKDCGNCHGQQMEEFERSHHSKAGQILGSTDNYLAGVISGTPSVVAGCESCHGGKVALDPASPNRIGRLSFPNSGIGRINPDGSLGSCSACHARHDFSRAQARQPENCGKCHLGPDHPQREIYDESKHGIAFADNRGSMHLEADSWIVGRDYFLAPTCATCHLSATSASPTTHDPGERISWTLRPAVSKKQENWEAKRAKMQEVCSACHSQNFVRGHYVQYDGVVSLYDEKFAAPATAVMDILKKNGSLKRAAAFGNNLEWIYYELWHHEGRRGRMGASMMGPDYTWWHGMYEVAKHFYLEFLPAVRETGDKEAIAYLERMTAEDPMHRWFNQTKEENKKALSSGELERLYQQFYPSSK